LTTIYTDHPTQIYINKSLFIELSEEQSLRIDRNGRWSSWQIGDHLYRRTYDSQIVSIKDGNYTLLSDEKHFPITQKIRDVLQSLSQKLHNGDIDFSLPVNKLNIIKEWINKSIIWSRNSVEYEKRLFHTAYPEGIQILPPDRYRDLVIQPALGCPSGNCTFCAFYKNNRFRIKSDNEFRRHIEAVKNLLGENIHDRNGIFLDSASALSLSQRRMINVLNLINNFFPNSKRGIASFLDPDHAPFRTVSDFLELKKRGLSQVTIGLETGSPSLRKMLGKSDNLEILKKTVDALKAADIQVALTVLIGAGGMGKVDHHRGETVNLIKNLDLSKPDIIYLSPLNGSIPTDRINSEMAAFKDILKEIIPSHISPYNMERFYYFS